MIYSRTINKLRSNRRRLTVTIEVLQQGSRKICRCFMNNREEWRYYDEDATYGDWEHFLSVGYYIVIRR